jgi:hypothetical protein
VTRDWREWHRAYDDPASSLSRRLAVVQRCIGAALDRLPAGRIRAISMCAGDGRDLLGVLSRHPRAADVAGRLVEFDPELADAAKRTAPAGISVLCGDAGRSDAYRDAAPADLVVACGIFGNVSDADVERTIRALPSLCAPGAVVIWTRHRRPPDLTVDIRRWFAQAGFQEREFVAPSDALFAVGVHAFVASPLPWRPDERWFRFIP